MADEHEIRGSGEMSKMKDEYDIDVRMQCWD